MLGGLSGLEMITVYAGHAWIIQCFHKKEDIIGFGCPQKS